MTTVQELQSIFLFFLYFFDRSLTDYQRIKSDFYDFLIQIYAKHLGLFSRIFMLSIYFDTLFLLLKYFWSGLRIMFENIQNIEKLEKKTKS